MSASRAAPSPSTRRREGRHRRGDGRGTTPCTGLRQLPCWCPRVGVGPDRRGPSARGLVEEPSTARRVHRLRAGPCFPIRSSTSDRSATAPTFDTLLAATRPCSVCRLEHCGAVCVSHCQATRTSREIRSRPSRHGFSSGSEFLLIRAPLGAVGVRRGSGRTGHPAPAWQPGEPPCYAWHLSWMTDNGRGESVDVEVAGIAEVMQDGFEPVAPGNSLAGLEHEAPRR